MDKKFNYTVVGLFVVLLSALLIVVSLWLVVGWRQVTYKYYAVFFQESVFGLAKDSVVRFNGVKVGFVKAIDLHAADASQVRIILALQSDTPVEDNTVAMLITQGMTGLVSVGLSANNTAPVYQGRDPLYPVIASVPSFYQRLDTALSTVIKSSDTVMAGMSEVFNSQTAALLLQTLEHVSTISATVAAEQQALANSLQAAEVVLGSAATASASWPQLMHDMQAASRAAESAFDLFAQSVPELLLTAETIKNAVMPLQRFNQDLEANPAILLRGKAPRQPGPGE